MRSIWFIALAAGLAGATAGRADVVIGTTVNVAPAAPGCAAPCDPGCAKECKPSLRDRVRNLFASRTCCPTSCAAPLCEKPAACPAPRCEPVRCETTRCPREKKCRSSCEGSARWERFKAWLCYQPTRGCCDQQAAGCRPAPLYTYFYDDCAQGPGCAQPPACCDKPGLWRRLCGSGHKLFASPAGHGCGAGTGGVR